MFAQIFNAAFYSVIKCASRVSSYSCCPPLGFGLQAWLCEEGGADCMTMGNPPLKQEKRMALYTPVTSTQYQVHIHATTKKKKNVTLPKYVYPVFSALESPLTLI